MTRKTSETAKAGWWSCDFCALLAAAAFAEAGEQQTAIEMLNERGDPRGRARRGDRDRTNAADGPRADGKSNDG